MGMDTSCGNKISLSKLFLFFFFQAFINVLDFLQHQFHVFLQALNLAGDVSHQCISLFGRRIQEAKVVFVGLDVVFQSFVSANQAFTVAVEISFLVSVSAYTAQAFFSSRQVQAVEQQIMGRVFSLGDRTVESIMTHRSELAWIDAAASAAQIRETVARAPHNRYPVGEGSLDKLLGVVCLKDLFLHLGDEGFDLRRLVAPAKFFHEGFEVYNALEQLRTEQLGYGIICDEFGVTRGIITLRDIFEALVGELPDPREEPDIVRREDGSKEKVVAGDVSIRPAKAKGNEYA